MSLTCFFPQHPHFLGAPNPLPSYFLFSGSTPLSAFSAIIPVEIFIFSPCNWSFLNCAHHTLPHSTTVHSSQKVPEVLFFLNENMDMEQDWFQIAKGVHKSCILSPCLFILYAEYIMRNAGLEQVQAGIKIAGRNINNLRYANDTILMAESKRNWRASWWKWKRKVKKLA